MTYNLLARTYSCLGEFRAAINSEKEALSIFESVVSVQLAHLFFNISNATTRSLAARKRA